jgi:hypothetical protein
LKKNAKEKIIVLYVENTLLDFSNTKTAKIENKSRKKRKQIETLT